MGALHIGPSSFLVAMREKEAVVLETWGQPALSAGVAALGSGRSKNLQGCAGKTVPESAVAGWGVRWKRTHRRSRLGGGGGSAV